MQIDKFYNVLNLETFEEHNVYAVVGTPLHESLERKLNLENPLALAKERVIPPAGMHVSDGNVCEGCHPDCHCELCSIPF